jgi:hypothetical protein
MARSAPGLELDTAVAGVHPPFPVKPVDLRAGSCHSWAWRDQPLIRDERRKILGRQGGRRMSRRNQWGQTRVAVLALMVALVAMGVSVYTYLQVTQRIDAQTQLTRMQELVERGRQETADALKRLEEQIRGRQSVESPPKP